jgi:uncharacterized membrane protein YccC
VTCPNSDGEPRSAEKQWRPGKLSPLGVERVSPTTDRGVRVTSTNVLPTANRRALRTIRALIPAWLLRMLRPAPLPVDWTRICAAAVGIGGPQIVGLSTGETDAAVLVSVGALCASFSDLTSSYRHRLWRVGLTSIFGAAGFGAGAVAGTPWQAAGTVVAISVLSVLSSRMGDVAAAAGAQMLTFCIVATGHSAPLMPLGEQILWFAAGELLLLAMVAATWPFRRTAPARGAVASVFEATLRLFDTAGTDRAVAARQDLTRALNQAHDVLISVTAASASRSRVHDRLYVALTRATPVVEASVALAHTAARPPARVFAAMRELARCTRTGDLPQPYPLPPSDGSAVVRALDQGVAELIDALRPEKLAEPQMSPERQGWRERFRAWLDGVTVGRTAWILALRMALCLAVAEGIGLALHLDQPYWIALTVALVLKPNSGSVFVRTVLRAAGTVLGVLLATAVLALVPTGWWMVPFMVVLAALIPEALSRHYGLFTTVVTSLVLLQMSQSKLFPVPLPAVRLLDSLIGCVVVLIIGYLLWPFERQPSLAGRLADAVEAVSEYVSLSLAGVAQGRPALRRRTYRELSDLRAALQQRLMEPTAASQVAELWWPSIIVLERVVDSATERAVLIERAGGTLSLQHAQRLVSSMRTIARQLRVNPAAPPHTLREQLDDVYAQVAGR